jgi:hypothetical protein
MTEAGEVLIVITNPGSNNRLFCSASMTSLWHVRKRYRRGSITQIDTAEMKNVNKKLKTESDIRIFKDYDSTVGDEHAPCKIFYFLPICRYSIFIVNMDILVSWSDIVIIIVLTSDTENYLSVWCQTLWCYR